MGTLKKTKALPRRSSASEYDRTGDATPTHAHTLAHTHTDVLRHSHRAESEEAGAEMAVTGADGKDERTCTTSTWGDVTIDSVASEAD